MNSQLNWIPFETPHMYVLVHVHTVHKCVLVSLYMDVPHVVKMLQQVSRPPYSPFSLFNFHGTHQMIPEWSGGNSNLS